MSDLSKLERAKRLLEGGCLLAVVGDEESQYCERGISALFSLVKDGKLKGCSVADVIIGKAAALLAVKGGVKEVYGRVMSRGAVEALSRYGVSFEYSIITDAIINRRGDGLCPMELAVKGAHTPDEAYRAVEEKLKELKAAKKA